MNPFLPRAAALVLAVASVLAVAPPAAANECTNVAMDHYCHDQTVDVPNGLPTQLNPVVSAIEHRYYVYVNVADCSTSPIGNDCTGAGEGPGTALGAVGIVYYESNGFGGLQRHQFFAVGWPNPVPADMMVLI